MYAFYSTLALGATVMMCMFAAMLAGRNEASGYRHAEAAPGDDWAI